MNAPHSGGSSELTRSSKNRHCPVCDRHHDADCSFKDDLVLCHNNTGHKSNKYEQNGWIYRKDTSDGRCGVFSRQRQRQRRPRDPAATYPYSETQRTARFEYPDGSKKVLPQYWDGSEWITKSGPLSPPSANKWPMYCESRVLGQSRVIELEGEKCVNFARSDGLLGAACQPGFAHNEVQVAERYQRLKEAGTELIVIVADNDETGRKRAKQSASAAVIVDLDFLILPAQFVWPGIPGGGSYDNAPGTGADRFQPLLDAIKEKEFQINGQRERLVEEQRSQPPEEPEKKGNEAFHMERCQTLARELGPRWRADHTGSNLWHGYLSTHWESGLTNCDFRYALNRVYNCWGWVHRDTGVRRSDLENLRAELGPEMGKPNRKLIPFTNGLLDLTKGFDSNLLAHDPSHWNRYCLPFDYDPKAAPPKTILWFLKDCLGHEEVVAMYRAFVWHVLMGNQMKCFLEITGPGDTGKSILANLIGAAIGYSNTVAIDMKRLEDSGFRFETSKFRGKRLLLCSESQGYSGSVEMMKSITGGDRIPAEMKHATKPCDFVFRGGFVYIGNSPIRMSDSTSAAINRRRSIRVTKVVPKSEQRDLLQRDDEASTYEGEFVGELGAFVKWCLEMDPAEARRALSGDMTSLIRAETEKEVLLTSDALARWANAKLVFAEDTYNSVGTTKDQSNAWLLPSYQSWLDVREPKSPKYGQHNFKEKLVSLLRDTLQLPLPPGEISKGRYRSRGVGSVVPCVRLRAPSESEEVPGVVDYAFGRRVPVTTRNEPVHEQTPLGNDRNEGNEEIALGHKGAEQCNDNNAIRGEVAKSRYSRSAHSLEGSQGELAIPEPLRITSVETTGSSFDVEAD